MMTDLLKNVLLRVGMIVSTVILGTVLISCNRETPAPIEIVPPEPTPTAQPTMTPSPILVYVSGEVLAPDVYELAPDSRIKQLVEAAGGFTDDADPAAVNLAQPLADGAHVHIPAAGELMPTPSGALASPVPQRDSTEIDLGFGGDLININTADLPELDKLPGIGPVTAQKILDYRAVNGPFLDIKAIMEVDGIGQGKFDQIKQLITTAN